MQQLFSVAITSVLAAPPPKTDLVIFADQRSYVAEIDSHQMLASAARYAVRNRVYLVPERFVAADSLCLCMLAPDGGVLGVQRACHHNVSMRQNNFIRSDEIQPFDTPFGRVGLMVDVDINMPQCPRAAALDGATLLISSQYMPLYDFYEDRINYGPVNAARSNGIQVIAAIGMGGVIVDASGHFISKYSEDLPVTAQLEPDVSFYDAENMTVARQLLASHRSLIDPPDEEGAANE